jgi:ABC-2 type transport system permease protein
MGANMARIENGYIISIVIQLISSVILVLVAAYKLNPLNKGIKFKRRNKKKIKTELKKMPV